MRYRFPEIEHGQIAEGYTVLTIEDHEAEILPLKEVKIVDGEEIVVETEDTVAILLAEKNGGELAAPEFSEAAALARLTVPAETEGALPPSSTELKEAPAIEGKRTGTKARPGETAELTGGSE